VTSNLPYAVLAAAMLCGCTPSLPGAAICSAQHGCDGGSTCVAGRCMTGEQLPVPESARRMQLEPSAAAQLDGGYATPLREPIVLADEQRLLLRFAVDVPPTLELISAWLELQPYTGCSLDPVRVGVAFSQVLSRWQTPLQRHWMRPRLGTSMRAAHARSAMPLRVELTEIVRRWTREGGRFHGLLLSIAQPGSNTKQLCYASGLGQAVGPRLVLFLRDEHEADG
jgi:hypothetical protein